MTYDTYLAALGTRNVTPYSRAQWATMGTTQQTLIILTLTRNNTTN